MSARRATADDIAFIAALARQTYPQYTLEHAEAWITNIIAAPNAAIFIGGEAVACVAAQREFWRPNELVADVLPMFGHPTKENPLGVLAPLRAAAQWARDYGCYAIRFGSSEGAKARGRSAVSLMKPFAMRLRAKPWALTYILEF